MKPQTAAALQRIFVRLPAPVLQAMLFVVVRSKMAARGIAAFVEAVGAMFVGAIRITAGLLLSLLGLGVFLFVIAGVIGLLLIGIRAL